MINKLTLGSLFDGSGGFPLAGIMCGIEPVWASEIEPFPIRVTTKRIPEMIHYGDISDLNGAELPPVDIVTFGSPCTDLSVAGKRKGLDGKSSVLFYEAIRIIKEMRDKTSGEYPRYAVWENVPGAFSSNNGQDFKAVLEAFIGVKAEDAEMPAAQDGKWAYADCIMGDGWSIAYRVLDAQYFGVPQRRRRIFLVADFAGERAKEILFESEGVPGNIAKSRSAWKRSSRNAEESIGEPGNSIVSFEPGAMSRLGGHAWEDKATCALRASMGDNQTAVAIENHPTDGRVKVDDSGKVQTLTSRMGTGGNNVPLTMKIRSGCEGGGKGALIQNNKSATLSRNNEQTVFVPTAYGLCSEQSNSMKSSNPKSGIYKAETSRTIDRNGINPSCNQGGMAVVSLQGSMIGRSEKNGPQGIGVNEDINFTLNATDKHAVAYDALKTKEKKPASFYPQMKAESQSFRQDGKANTLVNGTNPGFQNGLVESEYIVRRLTPTECARLQGFPDWWCGDLGTAEPSEEDIGFWSEVWETHRKLISHNKKPKSRKQIIKWLKGPHSDSAEYKMWGNGVALPCVEFVLRGIAEN